jgi:hypothetical protein
LKWFDKWSIGDDYFWDKGFTFLENSNYRSLLFLSICKSRLAQSYRVFATAGTEGLEMGLTLGKYTLAIGIGARV